MLRELRLENYRRFERHNVPFRDRTIIVGKNNAGKSTIVESLRLTSLVANRYRSLNFTAPPSWLDDPVGNRGVTPSLRDLNANLRTVFHVGAGPPATVTCSFASGETIATYIGPDEHVFAVVRDKSGKPVTSKSQALRLGIERIAVQPQVGPVQLAERRLDRQTVNRGLDSPLAPQHFRNQLHVLGPDVFKIFKELSEETWPSLQIRELVVPDLDDDRPLSLFVRDGKHVAELSAMGHGMQMWLQVMWFLARNSGAATVVLDEPDVYLHADLQRRLVRLLRKREQQVVIATHSIEIMSEVSHDEILVVTSGLRSSKWANTAKGVQEAIDSIGGVHNIQLARLANSRKCLFVEGKDMEILRPIADTLVPTADSLETLPWLSLGGWSGWSKAVGCAQLLQNAAGDQITSYCILDSDYFMPSLILSRLNEARACGVELTILPRKEIENYLLVASAIARMIARSSRKTDLIDLAEVIETKITSICSDLLEDALENMTTECQKGQRGVSAGGAGRYAKKYLDGRRSEPDGAVSVVGGKTAFKALSAWTKEQFGVSFTPARIAAELTPVEVHVDLRDFVESVILSRELPTRAADRWSERSFYATLVGKS